jgi:glycosyltransferase involved in cell wall biosynthesis
MSPALATRVESPTRILNVIRFPIGGIRSYLRYTYSRFDADKYGVTILTVDRPEAALLGPGMAPLSVDLITVSETNAFARLAIATNRLAATGRFDLVHSQGTTAALVTDLSARRHRLPHVVTLHETFRADQFRGTAGAIKLRLVARALRRADAVIAVSVDARDNLLAHLPLDEAAAKRVEVIRNGVASDILRREAPATRLGLRGRADVRGEAALIGYIGRFMPEKGFDVLVDAVELLRREGDSLPPFLVVAVNDGAFLREYRQQIAARGLESSFLFAGFQASAAGVLTELDAVVVPSRREACPLVAMEALILGCPLIASDCIGLRELTLGTPAITSAAGNPGSLAAAIKALLLNRRVMMEAALAFTTTATVEFESGRTAAALAAVFDRVRAGSRNPVRPQAAS